MTPLQFRSWLSRREAWNPPDAPAYLSNWAAHFDYLYLVGPRIPNPLPELLEEAAGGERFALYRIKK